MFGFIKKLFGEKPAEVTAEAPYKVEVAEAAPTPVAEKATEAVVKSVKPAKKAAPKKPAAGAKKGGRKPKSKPQA